MQRYSGQDDIVVGSPIANRQHERLEGLIGYFANMLVMRMGVNPKARFAELLEEVRELAVETYRHQHIPFERLVEVMPVRRSLNRTPIFQVVFALQNASSGLQELKGLEVEEVGTETWTARFDLDVNAIERNGQLDIVWIYNRDLFDRERIEQMARHYESLLTAAVQDPQRPVCELAMLSKSELQQFNIQTRKADRDVLQQASARNSYVAPRTAVEQTVAGVWQEALGLERVGIDDNFFDLGGYSLLLARVRFHLQERFKREIALVDCFCYPTVRLLAEKLEQ
jgi:non-ribosomal peptide synthetase component F